MFLPRNARLVREWMVQVVEQGTAAKHMPPGVAVAGKTGSARKETDRNQDHHSFVALVPADDPRWVLTVMVDDPQNGQYSSTTTAPTAGRILTRALAYLGELRIAQ